VEDYNNIDDLGDFIEDEESTMMLMSLEVFGIRLGHLVKTNNPWKFLKASEVKGIIEKLVACHSTQSC